MFVGPSYSTADISYNVVARPPHCRPLLFKAPNYWNEKNIIGQEFLVNILELPGYDHGAEETRMIKLFDGAINVIDCIEGVCVNTESKLRNCMLNLVRPVCVVSKIDRDGKLVFSPGETRGSSPF